MAWKEHDEFMDLPQSRHVVIYRNSDTGAEHQLIHQFGVDACHHCGHVKAKDGESIDFHQHKADTLTALNDHHKKVMQYVSKHTTVPRRSNRK